MIILPLSIPGTKEILVQDFDGSGFPSNKLMYLGAHMMNDPMLSVPKDEKNTIAFNVGIANNLSLVTEKVINVGDEIYGDYQYFKMLFNRLYIIYHY